VTAAVLVLFMCLPGLALFYGGLVRAKNMLSLFTQCFGIAGLALFYQVEFRDIGLSRSRFRMHYWTETAAISFNSESLRSRSV